MRTVFFNKQKRGRSFLWDIFMPIVFFAFVFLIFFQGVKSIGETTETEQLRSVKSAVTRATVQCYALEGQYPTSIEYLEQNYGLSVDEKKYFVHLESIADNLMPQITVLPKQPQQIDNSKV